MKAVGHMPAPHDVVKNLLSKDGSNPNSSYLILFSVAVSQQLEISTTVYEKYHRYLKRNCPAFLSEKKKETIVVVSEMRSFRKA